MNCDVKISDTELIAPITAPKLILNNYTGGKIEGEAFVADHIFSYIISGAHDIWLGNKMYSFKAGDFRFFKKNQLSRYVKSPSSDGFRSVAVHIDQYTLMEMSNNYSLKATKRSTIDGPLLLRPDTLLQGFTDSLMPYLNTGQTDPRIVSLKTKELVLLLLHNHPALKEVLFDFSEPGKIDLKAFMNSHYRYNVSLDKFAFLTGRSLSAFKRDFTHHYNMSPGRWLVQRRLEDARFLIEEKAQRPSEIYLDLGFEDLSHFSYAYKKAFGYAPAKKQN
ncbi:helix-turn-helix domain-containing protein [Taibaiella soli]|uniref:AraC family transcriptional regulator n=1 Tax=Taibaiella soli TaxID=1649169 RepID=A0A2W2B1J9_9BACT|nr:AraC family transcriptional regulator [Taibaiella soli]PZF74124.1 AraC family transcriptional regulator [Taibaiella soli]